MTSSELPHLESTDFSPKHIDEIDAMLIASSNPEDAIVKLIIVITDQENAIEVKYYASMRALEMTVDLLLKDVIPDEIQSLLHYLYAYILPKLPTASEPDIAIENGAYFNKIAPETTAQIELIKQLLALIDFILLIQASQELEKMKQQLFSILIQNEVEATFITLSSIQKLKLQYLRFCYHLDKNLQHVLKELEMCLLGHNRHFIFINGELVELQSDDANQS